MTHYTRTADEVLKEMTTSEKGLTSSEAEVRLRDHGKNVLKEKEKIYPIRIFIEQFNSPVVCILLGALIVSFILVETVVAIVIMTTLLIYAIIGSLQQQNT